MLFGEQLRRRHPNRLVAVLNGAQRGEPSDHGFARTDVSLHQALHRARRFHVFVDFPQYPNLRPGERERQQSLHRGSQIFALPGEDSALAFAA